MARKKTSGVHTVKTTNTAAQKIEAAKAVVEKAGKSCRSKRSSERDRRESGRSCKRDCRKSNRESY